MRNTRLGLLIFSLFFLLNAFSQSRSVVVVYDDSGSMGSGPGSRCNSVSYAIQIMTAFLPDEDRLHIVRMSDYQNPITIISSQKASHIENMKSWLCLNNSPTPIGSVHKAISILNAENVNEKLLIIFSDGDFNDFSQTDKDEILKFVEDDCSKMLLFNIDNIHAEFASWLYQKGVPNIYHSTSNPIDIINTMERITTSIFTLPDKGLITDNINSNEVKLNSVFPLKRLIVLDQQTNHNPAFISDAGSDTLNFDISQSFTVSKDNINSRITHIKNTKGQLSVIPAGQYLLTFNKPININNITFLPQVALELDAEIKGNFKSRQGNSIVLCNYDNEVEVIARIVSLQGKTINPDLLSEAEVKIINNHQESPMVLSDSVFKYRFKAKDLSTVSISAKHEGYYSFRSNLFSIRVDDCEKITLPSDTEFPEVKVTDKNKKVSVEIQPLVNGIPVRCSNYPDLGLIASKTGNVKIEIVKENDNWLLVSNTPSCACFAKTGKIPVELELWSESEKQILDKTIVYLNIVNVPFFKKCFKLILWILGIVLLIWYILGLIKKPRFCRDYKIAYEYKQGRNRLRTESYRFRTNPFTRWFVPYLPETIKIEDITFKAAPTKNFIYIDRESITNKTVGDGIFINQQNYTSKNIKKDLRLMKQIEFEVREPGNLSNIYRYITIY